MAALLRDSPRVTRTPALTPKQLHRSVPPLSCTEIQRKDLENMIYEMKEFDTYVTPVTETCKENGCEVFILIS